MRRKINERNHRWGIFLLANLFAVLSFAQGDALISGRITSSSGEVLGYATVHLKGTHHGAVTNDEGLYHLNAPAGKYTLAISVLGYKPIEEKVTLVAGQRLKRSFRLSPTSTSLDEVVVTGSSVGRVNRSAFNAVAIGTEALRNSTKNLSEALASTPGMKLRESGGVGSDMSLMMDGFSGKHVKVFIDGVPQEGVGGSFGLNNIPVNFADRIEVYKGVVPVGFGADAIGGVINIVTKKHRRGWFADASYSYGSFNTHRSSVNVGNTFRNGLKIELNAFQNYSDNSYWIDTPVEHFLPDGTTSLDATLIERVKRFNDTYHNEAVVAKIGVVDKRWTDRLMFGFTYSHMYKELQNGVIQKVVFGEKYRQGSSLMPSVEYHKRNFLLRGLSLTLTANYNNNSMRNVDTSAYHFNWLGEKRYQDGKLGEQSYQDLESKNSNWNATLTARYRLGNAHTFVFSHVLNTFHRKNESKLANAENSSTADEFTKITRKNISGLSYQFMPSEKWNASAFGKFYNQYNVGPVSTSETGTDSFVRLSNRVRAWGFGAAGTYFVVRPLQVKLSYERAYRLPTNEELFGNEDLELGSIGLRPERSDNVNLNINYNQRFGLHTIYAEGGVVYRNTTDYIQRLIGTYSGNKSYASYENHGKVKTKGYNVSARYSYGSWIDLGGSFTRMDVRDNAKTLSGASSQKSSTYGGRMPNQPYMFAGADISFNWRNLGWRGCMLTITYDNSYVHSFPLYSEKNGSAKSKLRVPDQFAHNMSVAYSIQNGKYSLSFECRNLTNEKLYDNFSLQKAGRAFYGKIGVRLGSGNTKGHRRGHGLGGGKHRYRN